MSIAFHGKLLPCKKAEDLTDYLTQFYSQLQITMQPGEEESIGHQHSPNISHIQT